MILKKLTIISMFFVLDMGALAQLPFQSVVMDATGVDSNDSLRFLVGILDNSNSDEVVYQEEHWVKSNEYGLVSFNVSQGMVTTGNWQSIDWSMPLSLKVEMSRKVGDSWGPLDFFGSQTFSAVPYAYYAAQANEGPQGEIGDQGDQGDAGDQGVVGEVGDTGEVGDAGLPGNYIDTVYWSNQNLVFQLSDGSEKLVGLNGGKGCTKSEACNYSANAVIDDGSCHWPGQPCNDGVKFTFGDVYNANCECEGFDYHLIDTTISIREPSQRSGCDGQTNLFYEGRNYGLVEIDGQCWFGENAKRQVGTVLKDSLLPQYFDPYYSGFFPKFDSVVMEEFGLLYVRSPIYQYYYGWQSINLDDVCPAGWHVSNMGDWNQIELNSGMTLLDLFSIDFSGNKKSAFLDNNNNNEVNNSLMFNAKWAGYGKYDHDLANYYFGKGAFFYVEPSSGDDLFFQVKALYQDFSGVRSHFGKDYYSIRCVKD